MLRNYFQKQLDAKIVRGVIVLDKEAGITSHDEVDRLRRIFKTRKIGHSGTLDPKVTGVLVCGLGRGTKVLEYVLLSEKVYDCEIVFHKVVERGEFEQVLAEFTGTITQLPPIKSSVKRVERERDIYRLELLDFAKNGRSASIRCAVERGTYIRKLCHDMGQRLQDESGQSVGAHMGDLRRIQAGPFSLDNSWAITSKQLEILRGKASQYWRGWWYVRQLARYIQPIELALEGMPCVYVDGRLDRVIASGADLFAPGVLGCEHIKQGERVQIVDEQGRALAVGRAVMDSEEMKKRPKGVAVEVDKVLSI